jgi:hypothetical protein
MTVVANYTAGLDWLQCQIHDCTRPGSPLHSAGKYDTVGAMSENDKQPNKGNQAWEAVVESLCRLQTVLPDIVMLTDLCGRV